MVHDGQGRGARVREEAQCRLPVLRDGGVREADAAEVRGKPHLLADAVLVVHAAFVVFVVGGLAATWVGIALGLRFALNPWFRVVHLAAIAFVVVESLLGYMCPLTIWEDALRGSSSGEGFIQRWIHAWLYWNAPAWVFTVVYAAFGALVAWTWVRFPPRR